MKSICCKLVSYILLLLVCTFLLWSFTPVQKILLTKVLSKYFQDVKISDVSIGLSRIRIKNFYGKDNDLQVRFSSLDFKWSLKDLIVLKSFKITDAVISGLILSNEKDIGDISYYKEDSNLPSKILSSACGIRNGISNVLKCFDRLSISSFSVDGSFEVYENILGDFSINLRDFFPSQSAELRFSLSSSFSRDFNGDFSMTGSSQVHRNSLGAVDSIKLDSLVSSKNRPDVEKTSFTLNVGINLNEKPNEFFLTLTNNQTSDRLINLRIDSNESTDDMVLKAEAILDNNSMNYFMFGKELSPLKIFINSDGEYNSESKTWTLKFNTHSILSQEIFQSIFPKLSGDAVLKSSFGVSLTENFLNLESITCTLNDVEDDQIKCSCDLQVPCKISFDQHSDKVLDKLKDVKILFNVDLLDMRIFRKILPEIDLSFTMKFSGVLELQNGYLVMNFDKNKTKLEGINASYENNEILKSIDCYSGVNILFEDKVRIILSGLSCVDHDGQALVQGDCNIALGRYDFECIGNFIGNLQRILKQPSFCSELNCTSGVISCSFDLTNEDAINGFYVGDVEVKLKAVSFDGAKEQLNGKLKTNLASASSREGEKNFDIDVNLKHIGETKLSVAGIIGRDFGAPIKSIRASVKSKSLCIFDVLSLGKLFKLTLFNKKTPFSYSHKLEPLDPTVPNCDISIEIKELNLKDLVFCSDILCDLKVSDSLLNIPDFKCRVLDAPFTLSLLTDYGKKTSSSPYCETRISFFLSDLNASKCMVVFGMNPAAFSGTFNVKGDLSYISVHPFLDAAPGLQGRIGIVGNSGHICMRNLMNSSQRNFLDLINVSGNFYEISDKVLDALTNFLEDIPYDKITASLTRENNGDIISNATLNGDTLSASFEGKMLHSKGLPLKAYGLRIDSQVNVKGELVELFDYFELCENSFDDFGRKIGPRFRIEGTVGSPDLSQIKNLMANAGAKVLQRKTSKR